MTTSVGDDPVQHYLDSLDDPARREALDHVRDLILTAAPDARPVISYRLPAFRTEATGAALGGVAGGVVGGFAATRAGCSYYPFSGGAVAQVTDRLQLLGLGWSKGAIHFTASRPLPDDLVLDLVQYRLLEIAGRGR